MHQSNNHNNVTMKKESPSVSRFELANGKGHTPKSVFLFSYVNECAYVGLYSRG